jgi:hypothetical protein
LRPLFDCLGDGSSGPHVAASRLIGRTARANGQANAGVIAFRHDPSLERFFGDWQSRANKIRGAGGNRWHEQTALSQLVLEAFDGRHEYRGAVFSDMLWNCEHDDDKAWLEQIRSYKPVIVHHKGNRWAKPDLRKAVEAALTTSV